MRCPLDAWTQYLSIHPEESQSCARALILGPLSRSVTWWVRLVFKLQHCSLLQWSAVHSLP